MKAKFLSVLLALTMVLSLLPTAALAEDDEDVAEINGTKYATLDEAVSKAQDEQTIKLLNDASTDTLKAGLTYDLAGHTLTYTGKKPFSYADRTTSFIDTSVSGTNRGGIISAPNIQSVQASINVQSGATLNLNNITFRTPGSAFFPQGDAAAVNIENCDVYAGVYCLGTNAATTDNYNVVISLSNSNFYATASDNDNCPIYINVTGTLNIDNCNVVGGRQGLMVRAGTANITNSNIKTTGGYSNREQYYTSNWGSGNELPAAALIVGNYNAGAATAYFNNATVTLTNTKLTGENNFPALYVDGNATYKGTVTISGDNSVISGTVMKGQNPLAAEISISSGAFSDLNSAIAYAADGAIIKLAADTTEDVVIPAGKNITLDLNGHKIVDSATPQNSSVAVASRKHTITNNGTLTIIDSVGTGVVDNISHGKAAVYNNGTLTIAGGTITRSVDVAPKFSSDPETNSWYVMYNAKGATMTIDGGEIIGNSTYSSCVCNLGNATVSGGTIRQDEMIAFKNDDTGTLTVTGGTIISKDQAIQNWKDATITGGDIEGSVYTWACVDKGVGYAGKTTITGGKITGDVAAVNYDNGSAKADVEIIGDAEIIGSLKTCNYAGGAFTDTHNDESSKLTVSGGHFSEPVKKEYLDSNLNAELYTGKGDTPYSYYPSMDDAKDAAKEANGGTVTDLENSTSTTKYTVTLDYNDGETADEKFEANENTIVILPTPTRSGRYTFLYWTDSSKAYNAGAEYSVTGNVTLTAIWRHIGSSSFSSSGSSITVGKTENGTITVSPKTASKGETVTITVKPSDGYELDRLTAADANGDTIRLTEQRDGTYTFTMPAGKVEVNGTFVKKSAQTFVDVPENAYYAPAVAWAVEKGVTTGTSATTFSPDTACTRAQIVTFLYRAAGSPAVKSTVNPFTDVNAGDYYYNAVLWAVENSITTSTSATTFSPNESCTRAQCVTFLYRAVGSAAAAKAAFTDVSADAYYAPAVDWAVEKGVTTGTSATTFSPDAACTRAQIVTFLYRAYQGK